MSRRSQGPRLIFLAKRGGYYVRWTEGGRTREKSCATRDLGAAEAFLAAFLGGRRRELSGPRDPNQFPIAEALGAYGREHGPHTAAPARIGYCIDALASFWAENMVGDITRETCRAYQRHRSVADGTVRTELSCLRAALNHAVREGRLTRSPHVWLPLKPAGKDRWLTRHEAAALLRAARQEPRSRLHGPLFVLLGLYTGARKEALLSLRWPQVDLDRGRINFNPPGRRRTAKGRPIIPVPRGLLWFLRKARERGAELGYVLNIDGRPIGNLKHSFATAAIRAGLCEPATDKAGRPKFDAEGRPIMKATVTPHTLRHTAGTWMAQEGVPLWDIAGYLGHSHARTTELYSHHHPDHLERARAALD